MLAAYAAQDLAEVHRVHSPPDKVRAELNLIAGIEAGQPLVQEGNAGRALVFQRNPGSPPEAKSGLLAPGSRTGNRRIDRGQDGLGPVAQRR